MITKEQLSIIKLIVRSPDQGDGWRKCLPEIFEKIIAPMTDALVEKNPPMVRLTAAGQTIAEWCC